MPSTLDGDLVLHFYEDDPFGRNLDHYFCGISVVDGTCEVVANEPPRAAEWAGRQQYYRVNLRDFTPLSIGRPLRDFAAARNHQILPAIESDPDSPFIAYQGSARLAQGKYLSECGPRLYELLSAIVDEPLEVSPSSPTKPLLSKLAPFDYDDYVEGQRSKREAWFFSRNPRLVRDAKELYKYTCQACQFRFDVAYSEIGRGYIEIHHLDPLSEREGADVVPRLTNLAQVTALCANCHRIIHRLIRARGRPVTVAELQSHMSK